MRKKIFHSFLTLTCLVLAIFTAVLVLGVYQLEQRQLESSLQSETEMLASGAACPSPSHRCWRAATTARRSWKGWRWIAA